ncbi:MAG: hypothetical protein DRI90_22870 [Deltaproteobacteria bacterium]|nr:MAG: hypothetical protein DRI90_22870 [Deltaproteobacteria bacterium]
MGKGICHWSCATLGALHASIDATTPLQTITTRRQLHMALPHSSWPNELAQIIDSEARGSSWAWVPSSLAAAPLAG